jgi:hypothetical protein
MSEETKKQQMVTFIDGVGRTYLATLNPETTNDKILGVKNPVILHVTDENQKMQVRLIPLIFREFLADRSQDSEVEFPRNMVAMTNITEYDFRLQSQYDQMFNKNNAFVPPQPAAPQPQKQEEPKVVNLFDE